MKESKKAIFERTADKIKLVVVREKETREVFLKSNMPSFLVGGFLVSFQEIRHIGENYDNLVDKIIVEAVNDGFVIVEVYKNSVLMDRFEVINELRFNYGPTKLKVFKTKIN